MTTLLMPQVLGVLTSAVVMDHANIGQVSFSTTDGHYYTFLLNHAGVQRLGKQIERALKEAPVSRRKRRLAAR